MWNTTHFAADPMELAVKQSSNPILTDGCHQRLAADHWRATAPPDHNTTNINSKR